MAKMFINDSTLTAIADAIRAKTKTAETMLPSEMAALITAISTGVELPYWVSDMYFVEATCGTSDATTLTVPCPFEPDCALIYTGPISVSGYLGIGVDTVNYHVSRGTGSGSSSYIAAPSWTLSGSKLTFTANSNLKFKGNQHYYCILWTRR